MIDPDRLADTDRLAGAERPARADRLAGAERFAPGGARPRTALDEEVDRSRRHSGERGDPAMRRLVAAPRHRLLEHADGVPVLEQVPVLVARGAIVGAV